MGKRFHFIKLLNISLGLIVVSLVQLKPVNPSFRHQRRVDTKRLLSGDTRYSPLVKGHQRSVGRNNQGKITSRHRGGGHKKAYRVIDYKRNKDGIPARVATIEYDPFRTSFISLLVYADGEKRYILTPKGIKVGDIVESGGQAEIKLGSAMELKDMPLGTVVHNVELTPGRGGVLGRAAGTGIQLTSKEGKYALLRLPSGESRRVLVNCRATVGVVSNDLHANESIGTAGRARNMGRRPSVRGLAMSPKDHPHGGGEGGSSIGMTAPKSPWGWKTLGRKTRNNPKTDQYIVRRRKK